MKASTSNQNQTSSQSFWKVKLLYDGDCPLCMREVRFLQKKDKKRGLVNLVDIADNNYNPDQHCGVDYETAMGRIHAILPDGTILTDIEAFRYVYEVLGMGWVYAVTKIPVVGKVANWVYGIWAKFRLSLTGRPDLEAIIAERENNKKCNSDSCDY
ncbi:thiol-disulfide oxidoreductase DCC family protein [Crocosphaera sp. Alani8]|uniref:thiol-disulfide oxidoreductase DCC family protein n=1 Tax=Crocosphaera sp. Alani8 TaxID=3038952 RepID=UPI00313DCE1E